jgi:hypothetical protein
LKKGNITSFGLDPKKPPETDWQAFDSMSEEERHQAAVADPDCPPATEAQLARARRVPTVGARQLVQLGGSEPALKAPPRRRQKPK